MPLGRQEVCKKNALSRTTKEKSKYIRLATYRCHRKQGASKTNEEFRGKSSIIEHRPGIVYMVWVGEIQGIYSGKDLERNLYPKLGLSMRG